MKNSRVVGWRGSVALLLLGLLLLGACGEDESPGGASVTVTEGDGDEVAFGEEANTVVTDEGTFIVEGDPGQECVRIDDETCVDLGDTRDQHCGAEDAQVDVVIIDGEVAEAVCYPSQDSGVPLEEVVVEGDGTITLPQNANGAVITFDEETNGEPIEGDVQLDAERMVIFGNGIEETILAGSVTLASNNSRIRALTVEGDVEVANNANNSAVVFCRIKGSITISSNGMRLIDTEVFGDVRVDGNDATLLNVGVGGEWDVPDSATCRGCYSFDDEDGDFVVSDEERGEELGCGREGSNDEEPDGQ